MESSAPYKIEYRDFHPGISTAFGCAIFALPLGLLCSLTGIGAIVGLPLFLFGVISLIVGFFRSAVSAAKSAAAAKIPFLTANCPRCRTSLELNLEPDGILPIAIDCPACQARLIPREGSLVCFH